MRTSFFSMILFLAFACGAFVSYADETPATPDKDKEQATAAPTTTTPVASDLSVADRERLETAEQKRAKWMKYLADAKNVDEMVRAKRELDSVNQEISEILAGKAAAEPTKEEQQHQFKDTSERTIIPGPIGFVLELTEWILEKCYAVFID